VISAKGLQFTGGCKGCFRASFEEEEGDGS
jgi:hypothetical protein